jgi:3-oxoadipate enol-lactonase
MLRAVMHVIANGVRTHVALEGHETGPTLMFSHSLGAALGMWDPQLELADRFRLLRYDTRGHGQSEAPEGPYRLEDLVADAVSVIDALGIERVWFVGLSMGGMVAQLFALTHPERLHGVALCATFSEFPSVAHAAWDERIETTRREGMESQVEPAMQRWFTAPFRERHPGVVDRVREMVRGASVDGYIGCCEAVRGLALSSRLGEIRLPALVVAGQDDPGAGPEQARALHAAIASSDLRVLGPASHLCNVEQAGAFNAAIRDFVVKSSG